MEFGGEAEDLNQIESYVGFLTQMHRVFEAVHRVLVQYRVFAVVTGHPCRKVDGRGRMFPLHADYIQMAEQIGFDLWDMYLWHLNIPPGSNRTILGSFPYPHKV